MNIRNILNEGFAKKITMCVLVFALMVPGTSKAQDSDDLDHEWFGEEVTLSSNSFETPPAGYHGRISNVDISLGSRAGKPIKALTIRVAYNRGELDFSNAMTGSLVLRSGTTIGNDLSWETPRGLRSRYQLNLIDLKISKPFFVLEKYHVVDEVVVYEGFEVGKSTMVLGKDLAMLPTLPDGYGWKDLIRQSHFNTFSLERRAPTRGGSNASNRIALPRVIKNVYLKAGHHLKLSHQSISNNLHLRGQRPLKNPVDKAEWINGHKPNHRKRHR